MASSKLPNYGAVASAGSVDEEHAVDQSFDAANTYYLTDNSRWTIKKMFLIAVPILAAAMIVGGFALFLLRDFSHLYPGRGGDKTSYHAVGVERVVPSSSTHSGTDSAVAGGHISGNSDSQTVSTKNDKGKSWPSHDEDIAATCGVHPDCASLIGNCCPASSGIMLDCCHN